MHEYSVDVENNKVIFYLSIVSIFISSVLTMIINLWIEKIPILRLLYLLQQSVFLAFYILYLINLFGNGKFFIN